MLVSDPVRRPIVNSLHRLAAAGGALLGAFLMLGAFGHFMAVWPVPDHAMSAADASRFALLLPGMILLTAGLINAGLVRVLWTGTSWSLNLALASNVLTAIYLAYLLARDVPGHPIGVFAALVSSHVVLLGAIRLGLVWPAPDGRVVRDPAEEP